ncbi:MAG: 50S ribosomal protein L25/general stress protein Ctc [Pseudomonadota bacterium]
MADKIDLVAELREDQGKGASRRLRREGKVPAILYGAGRPPRAISLQHNKLIRALEDESFYSSVLNIKVGDKNQETILKDVQRHPAKPQIMHIDLQRIVAGEVIRMSVPVHFLNEETAVGVKQDGGILNKMLNEVDVQCLPKDLPEYLEIDVAELEIGGLLNLSDLKLPKGVELIDLSHGDESDDKPLVQIVKSRAVVEEDEEGAPEAGEVPTVGDEAADDAAED